MSWKSLMWCGSFEAPMPRFSLMLFRAGASLLNGSATVASSDSSTLE